MSLDKMDYEINSASSPINNFSGQAYFSMNQENIPETKGIAQEMLQALIDSGYTKMGLARDLGISPSTVKRILQGLIVQPGNRTFSKLIRLYCAAFLLKS